jgi:molybdopterin-guanine dinucleotide biosynthesis protein MobB
MLKLKWMLLWLLRTSHLTANGLPNKMPPIIGFTAYSGTGKTSLLTKLIPLLRDQQIRVSVLKHSHHPFEIDIPGKDSFELRKAGAYQTLISSAKRKALITEFSSKDEETTFNELIAELDQDKIDLILVEGFKWESFNKIELHREELAKPYLYKEDKNIIALAVNHSLEEEIALPILDLNNPQEISDFIISFTGIIK